MYRAQDGVAALDLVEYECPICLLTDDRMPRLDDSATAWPKQGYSASPQCPNRRGTLEVTLTLNRADRTIAATDRRRQMFAPSGHIRDVRKIAILRANGLGDFIFILPALEAMHTAYPQAEIVLLANAWHAG